MDETLSQHGENQEYFEQYAKRKITSLNGLMVKVLVHHWVTIHDDVLVGYYISFATKEC